MTSNGNEERGVGLNDLLNDLRKKATRKTALMNKQTYDEIDWSRVEKERALARQGMLVDAGLIVIEGADPSTPVWDLRKYAFLLDSPAPKTVNPKLWEQGKLNLHAGLFKVTDNIYQVRGFDMANMTFVRGKTGWIVIDSLSTKETSAAALQFVWDYFGEIPISAVVLTHSHVDHYGGVYSLLSEFAAEDVRTYAPKRFSSSVIEENVTAGVAMARRGIYAWGTVAPKDEKGQVDVGIGKGSSLGTVTLTRNIHEIGKEFARKVIDGVRMEFLLAMDSEAPSEMLIYVPRDRSLCIAELCNATLHNLYTMRGAKVRDAVAWARAIQKAIDLWGKTLTTVFGTHNWPRFGTGACIDYLEKQRDFYQYLNDQTLRLINKGYTIEDVGRMVRVPRSLTDEWYNSELYGTVSHNAKAVYQRYLGWYDGNPVDLNKLPPEEAATRYVEYMGGEECVLNKARESFRSGEYQWVAEVMKQVIYANPDNRDARLLCADALEQLGYVAESGIWRDEYLTGAQELRHGVIPARAAFITGYVLDNLPLENVLYLLSIRLDGVRAGDLDFKINFVIPDRDEAASTEVKRGVFRYLKGELARDAAVTTIMPKAALYQLASTNEMPDSSEIVVQGDVRKWKTFLSLRDTIDTSFNIVTPVAAATSAAPQRNQALLERIGIARSTDDSQGGTYL